MPDTRIAFVGGDQPEYHHTDLDGDFLFIATDRIRNVGPGVYFRTAPDGSSVPLGDLDGLIAQLQAIAEAAAQTEES